MICRSLSVRFLLMNILTVSHFLSVLIFPVITYKVQVVVGSQIASASSASCWLNLAGKSLNTGTVDIPKGQLEFRFRVRGYSIIIDFFDFFKSSVLYEYLCISEIIRNIAKLY